MSRIASIIVAATVFCAPALAQQTSSEDAAQNGRYSMTPTDGGFLRLDTRTGAVSMCRPGNGGVQCRAGADELAALENEIGRLAKENAELRRKLAEATDKTPSARLRNALPSDEEVNKAMGWMEQFFRRMMRVMREETPQGERL